MLLSDLESRCSNFMSVFAQARFPQLQIPTGMQEDAPEKIDNSKVKL